MEMFKNTVKTETRIWRSNTRKESITQQRLLTSIIKYMTYVFKVLLYPELGQVGRASGSLGCLKAAAVKVTSTFIQNIQ
jgi:hypothetical protein